MHRSLFTRPRRVFVPALCATLLLMLSLAPSASAAQWTLIDNHQNPCYAFPQGNWTTKYYAVWIQGTWSHAVSIGASGLPSGASSWTYDSPIPPGSSDGKGSLAYVAVQIPSSTSVGEHTARLWASDGGTTESVPIGLNVQSKCGNY